MTIKEELKEMGMQEADFDRHDSDLYVRVTPVSKRWMETYRWKKNVSVFRDQIEGVLWYDIPFAACEEQLKERKEWAERFKNFLKKRI